MQKIVIIYITASLLIFLISLCYKYNSSDNYFTTALQFYSKKHTKLLFYNFSIAIILLILQLIIKIVFSQIKEIEKHKIIQLVKRKLILIFFVIYFWLEQFRHQKIYLVIWFMISSFMHKLTIIRSKYVINIQYLNSYEHYKLITFLLILLFIDFEFTKNSLIWILNHSQYQQISLIFFFFNFYASLTLLLPLFNLVLNTYERFTLFQFISFSRKISFINIYVNIFRLIISFIVGIWILRRIDINISIWFIRILLQILFDYFPLYIKIKKLKNITKQIECLQIVTKQQMKLKQDNTCLVCFQEIEQGRRLPCKHIFHLSCLNEWLQKSPNRFCPKCKKEFKMENKNNNINEVVRQKSKEQLVIILNILIAQKQLLNEKLKIIDTRQQYEYKKQNKIEKKKNKEELMGIECVGSLAYCLPCQARYNRKSIDFERRKELQNLNNTVNYILQCERELQVLMLDQ